MADFIDEVFPSGWVGATPELARNVTQLGRPGQWNFQRNGPYKVFRFGVSFLRSHYETASDLTYDDIWSFYHVASDYSFRLDDIFDNTASMRGGTGVVSLVNGVYRLMKRYTYGGTIYEHPVQLPVSVTLSGVSGTSLSVSSTTGIVANATSTGTWTGTFHKKVVVAEGSLQFQMDKDGTAEVMSLVLEEQLDL